MRPCCLGVMSVLTEIPCSIISIAERILKTEFREVVDLLRSTHVLQGHSKDQSVIGRINHDGGESGEDRLITHATRQRRVYFDRSWHHGPHWDWLLSCDRTLSRSSHLKGIPCHLHHLQGTKRHNQHDQYSEMIMTRFSGGVEDGGFNTSIVHT